MKVVFASNYLNHHQLPICLEFLKQTDGQFVFVATAKVPEERLALGYANMNKQYPWVVCAYESYEEKIRAKKLIEEADVVITGSAPDYFIKNRLKKNKLTFRYSERIYKRKPKWYKQIVYKFQHYFRHVRHKNLYMLCSSAYTASDYAKTGAFISKCYKWGYFPQVKEYADVKKIIDKKEKNSIVWVGRFIGLKNPEYVVSLAERLKNDGYMFSIKMIGTGELVEEIKSSIVEKGLENQVEIMGAMSPEEVRKEMENSQIHIFTSDRNEGWGAVLNEAMNSACACVCANEIGAAKFLMEDNSNGLLFNSGDVQDLIEKVEKLLNDEELTVKLATNAYDTITKEWNAQNAVNKFLTTCDNYFSKGKLEFLFNSGVLSKSE